MKRILIIEDDRDIVELVRYNLANEGFQISAALDGQSNVATGGTGLATSVLSDLDGPVGVGAQALLVTSRAAPPRASPPLRQPAPLAGTCAPGTRKGCVKRSGHDATPRVEKKPIAWWVWRWARTITSPNPLVPVS